MAFAWIPKATVQAALGGLALSKAKEKGLGPQYEEWGQAMLTTAVFAICLTAPLGAIFINTLGTKWLNYDGDVNMSIDQDMEATKGDSKLAYSNAATPDLLDGQTTERATLKNSRNGATVVPVTFSINGEVDKLRDDKTPIVEEI